ncbi:MAG: hypothetical protein A3I17_01965 [Candidatus Rokubacteria bacterium RIFCSPLOWO2_02_FULL_72_37]|nr:MAG: hypothetical protein A3I17_01965 [Candidatus Rokubacteria bacterium RIFCSPLOWO2_02_FULL_72_37]
MNRLFLTAARDEVARRRGLVPSGQIVEAWPDQAEPAVLWIGEETRALLESVGEPIKVDLTLPADAIPVYYGPRLCDVESLPREESLKGRVVSGHGIAVAWITLDRFGERASYEPRSASDPVFHLRRVGGGAGHLWRLFRTRDEAVTYMREAYGRDSEGAEWAQGLAVADFAELLRLHAERGDR